MIDPRLGTLAVTGALAGYVVLANVLPRARSAQQDAEGDAEHRYVPQFLNLRIEESSGTRRVSLPRSVLIGRGANVDLPLSDPLVSRLHARIERRDDGVYVEDLGSRNGVVRNGLPVRGAVPLEPGDVLRIGSANVVFEGVGEWR